MDLWQSMGQGGAAAVVRPVRSSASPSWSSATTCGTGAGVGPGSTVLTGLEPWPYRGYIMGISWVWICHRYNQPKEIMARWLYQLGTSENHLWTYILQ